MLIFQYMYTILYIFKIINKYSYFITNNLQARHCAAFQISRGHLITLQLPTPLPKKLCQYATIIKM